MKKSHNIPLIHWPWCPGRPTGGRITWISSVFPWRFWCGRCAPPLVFDLGTADWVGVARSMMTRKVMIVRRRVLVTCDVIIPNYLYPSGFHQVESEANLKYDPKCASKLQIKSRRLSFISRKFLVTISLLGWNRSS